MVLFAAAGAAPDLDLEQRVAKLEAATARSGNGPSKLTFHMHGQVNRAPLLWNDGFDQAPATPRSFPPDRGRALLSTQIKF